MFIKEVDNFGIDVWSPVPQVVMYCKSQDVDGKFCFVFIFTNNLILK